MSMVLSSFTNVSCAVSWPPIPASVSASSSKSSKVCMYALTDDMSATPKTGSTATCTNLERCGLW